MAEVKILLEGYTSADNNQSEEEKTQPTISLIRSKDIIMVIDPGVVKSQNILVEALKKEGIGVNDVNFVFLTHSHADHFRNIGMFPEAKLLEYFALWNNDIAEEWEEDFTDDIKIIKTPGHNYTSLTLVADTDMGKIAVCGDVFWKENGPKNDPYANDTELLQESRKKVLEMADYIIPGHSGMFKVKK